MKTATATTERTNAAVNNEHNETGISVMDEIEATVLSNEEGNDAVREKFIILDTERCIKEKDGTVWQLCDERRVAGQQHPLCWVGNDLYTITDEAGNEHIYDALYINNAGFGTYKAKNISGTEVYKALKSFKANKAPAKSLIDVSPEKMDEFGDIEGLECVAGAAYEGDVFGEELFMLMYNRLYSTDLSPLRDPSWEADLCLIAKLLGYEHVCYKDDYDPDNCYVGPIIRFYMKKQNKL